MTPMADTTYYLTDEADPFVFALVIAVANGCICDPTIIGDEDDLIVSHDEGCPLAE
jgi:hypothetical protein